MADVVRGEWHYDSARVDIEIQHHVCLMDMWGPVTANVLKQVRDDTRRMTVEDAVHCYIVDWSKALFAMPAQALTDMTIEGEAHCIIRTPVAYVCESGQMKAFQDHAFNMIEHGITRGVFASFSSALAWASEKVAAQLLREHRELTRLRAAGFPKPTLWANARLGLPAALEHAS